jgi:hypothetical protein
VLALLLALALFLFAFLHTLSSISQDYLAQAGYFDLYLENSSKCWAGTKYSPAIEPRWRSSIVQKPCGSSETPSHYSNSSIRHRDRYAIDRNCTFSTSNSYSADAGVCFINRRSGLFALLSAERSFQCLPSFVIAGAMKSGTGELMKWLHYHPFLRTGSSKGKREMHFFTRANIQQKLQDSASAHSLLSVALQYADSFPELDEAETGTVYMFEKSPDYLRDERALRSLHKLLPNVKLIFLLRDPSIRALSEFLHHCRHGRYVRLLKDVDQGGRHWRKGTVLRRLDSLKRETSIDQAQERYAAYVIDVQLLPKRSFEVLHHPCTASEAVAYFTQTSSNSRSSLRLLSTPPSNVSISAISSSSRGQWPPEIDHGFYYDQLRSVLDV